MMIKEVVAYAILLFFPPLFVIAGLVFVYLK